MTAASVKWGLRRDPSTPACDGGWRTFVEKNALRPAPAAVTRTFRM